MLIVPHPTGRSVFKYASNKTSYAERSYFDFDLYFLLPKISDLTKDNKSTGDEKMNQLVSELKNVEKSYLNKDVIKIEDLTIYENQKIGIVGKNGEGKTTLLKLIAGEILPEIGTVNTYIDFKYYAQIKDKVIPDYTKIDAEYLSRLNVPEYDPDNFSGGEQTRMRLAEYFSTYHFGLLMDEPTTHLDQEGIQLLVDQLKYYYGTLVAVSHDRYFLDEVVDTIWEIQEGEISVYPGNYSNYQEQKELERLEQENAYSQFVKEKKRLEQAAKEKQAQANKMSQVSTKQQNRSVKPDRLSSSKQKDSVQKAVHKSAKAIEKRAEQLREVEQVQEERTIQFPTPKTLEIHNDFPIMGQDIALKRGDKQLFNKLSFQFPLGKRIGIVGPNGSGKSTLLQYILDDGEGVTISKNVVFSTYQQMAYQLNSEKSLVDYLMEDTEFTEPFVRSVLNNLGFNQNTVSKKSIKDLSGGEATRLVIAKLFTDPSNVLILDEPTNFIDIQTIKALEELMKSYPGTVIFTSHDRYFMANVAEQIWTIENGKLILSTMNVETSLN